MRAQRPLSTLMALTLLAVLGLLWSSPQSSGATLPERVAPRHSWRAAGSLAGAKQAGRQPLAAGSLSSLPAEAQASIARALESDLSFTQLARLSSTDKILDQGFGLSVAISGDTVVVGAPAAHTHNQNSTRGAAYVFVKPASGWRNMTQAAKLTAGDGEVGDYFGYSVAISGNVIVVGAPNHTVKTLAGALYVFVQPSGGWTNMTQTAELTSSAANPSDFLGWSVGMSGNTIVASAPGTNVGNTYIAGAAYVFVKPAGGWTNMTETAQLTASDRAFQAQLGNAIAIAGNTVAVADEQYLAASGAVYVFVEPAGGWVSMTQTAKLTPADSNEGGGFAASVATNGGAIIATDPGYYPNPDWVDVFVEPAGGWADMTAETAQLSASNGTESDGFGYSLTMAGNVAVVGARGTAGAAYVFVKPPGGWSNMTQTTELQSTDGQIIGWSVATSGTTVVTGSAYANGVGAVYVFGSQ